MIPPELEAEIDACCDRFEAAWIAGDAPSVEEYLARATVAARPHLRKELVALERHYRRDDAGTANGQAASDGDRVSDVRLDESHRSAGLHVRCPHCSNPMEILADTPYVDVTCCTCGSTFNLVERESRTTAASTLRRLGRFDLVARLGVGGFGTVWKARDTELDRLVAIKIPRKGQLTPTDVEQFFREARAAAQLRHPNIVAVYEVGRADDTVFIVSDLVRGVALSDYLTGHKPSFTEIAELGVKVSDALQHAHEQGVVHRDLKPSNIMIDESGAPLILDFGLAKREIGEITMTVDGQILGTPGYMSPEQARGQSHWTDRRSDVYSLGTVLFRMATGELPFRGNARMQLHHKLTSDPPDPRRLNHAIPRDLATILLKCIERDPNHRYSTAQAVARELQRFLNGEPIHARPLSRAARTWRWARRKPATATACALAAALAVGGPLIAWQQRQLVQQRDQRISERDEMVRRNKIDIDVQSAEITLLNEELAALRGGRSGVAVTLPGWRLSLINDLVTARQDEMAAALADDAADHRAAIQAGLGLGIMLAQLGRNEEALATLEATERRIATSEKAFKNDAALTDAHADCWQRIGRLQQLLGDDQSARASIERALALRQELAGGEPSAADTQIRLLETTMQKTSTVDASAAETLDTMELSPTMALAREATAHVKKHWPATPDAFYRLACQLAKCDVLLGEER